MDLLWPARQDGESLGEFSSIGGTPQDVVLGRKWGGPLGAECADWLAPCPGPLPLAEPGHVQW